MQPITNGAIERLRREPDLYDALKGLLRAENETRDALERGTYTVTPQYGKWGTVWCPVTGMRDGFTPPTWANRTFGYLPTFTSGQSMQGVVEVPEVFVEGGPWVPSVVFTFDGATTAGNLIEWVLSCHVAGPGSVLGPIVTAAASYTVGAGDNARHCVVRMPVPDLRTIPHSVVLFGLSRSGAGAVIDPMLLGVRWTYRKQVFGGGLEP